MNPINIDKVNKIVETLVRGKVIDKISETMDSGFGEVIFKVKIDNKTIKTIYVTDTKTVKVDQS